MPDLAGELDWALCIQSHAAFDQQAVSSSEQPLGDYQGTGHLEFARWIAGGDVDCLRIMCHLFLKAGQALISYIGNLLIND